MDKHVSQMLADASTNDDKSCEAGARIRDQIARVASLQPCSEAHRTATAVLLLLQDSAHVASETRKMIRLARAASRKNGDASST